MILRKIIRIIQLTVQGLWLRLGIPWSASNPSVEQKQSDVVESSPLDEITVTNNLSDKTLQGDLSKGSPHLREISPGEFLGNDFCTEDDQDGTLSDAPVEQPSFGKGESFESANVAGVDTKDLAIKQFESPVSHYRRSDQILTDPPKDMSWVFRSPLEPPIKQEQSDASESSVVLETSVVAGDSMDNAPSWESSKDSSHLEETVSGEFPSDDFCATDDHDDILNETSVDQAFLGNSESFESGNVVEGDRKNPSPKESEFSVSHYRGSDEAFANPPEHTFPEPDVPLGQTTADDLDVQHFHVDENDLSLVGSTEISSGPKKSGKKVPRNIGARRTSQTQTHKSKPKSLEQQHPPVSHPELICRITSGPAWQWEILLSVDDECRILEVRQEGKSLDMVDGHYRPASYAYPLQIVFDGDDQMEFLMFDDEPLIFKMKKGWTDDGRRVGGITKGYFIVIVPSEWKREGHVPVKQEGCSDLNFVAHYFFRNGDEPTEDVDRFEEYELSFANSFELKGERVFDNAEEGELFVGSVPELAVNSSTGWIRVGEERKDGWKGENFKPAEQSLAEVLKDRQGRFFIRVFDAEAKRRESSEFRYLRELRKILVNGERYTECTLLVPSSEGHFPTKVRFIGINGVVITPKLPAEVKHVDVRQGDLIIAPHPDANRVPCTLESGSGRVDILLELPRVWWRLERSGSGLDEWRDTPLVMTRRQFRDEAHSNATIRLRLPRQIRSFRVGFDDELDQMYRSQTKEEDGIAIPLSDFVDYSQIDRRLIEEVFLNVQCEDFVLALIQISADPVPTIISFACMPMVLSAGEKAVLHWKTQNAEANGTAIEPGIGAVEPSGTLEVAPRQTTTYTLRLAASDMDDVTRSVAVKLLLRPDKRLIAMVKRVGGGWRCGKGFSLGELLALGLTATDVSPRSIPIDKNRRSTHQINITTIEEKLNNA